MLELHKSCKLNTESATFPFLQPTYVCPNEEINTGAILLTKQTLRICLFPTDNLVHDQIKDTKVHLGIFMAYLSKVIYLEINNFKGHFRSKKSGFILISQM